jgi:patatin-like phospholipase/acyl hydrolase
MLAAPNKKRRPLFAAKDIKAFYMNHAPKIFPQLRGPFGRMMRIFRSMSGPSYDGKHLHEVVREKLGSTRLHQTLTNVVIPTFDIKWLQPTIFSSYEVKKKNNNTMDALLSDICISTSAAPTYLPAHFFRTEDCHGNIKEFNLIDGGVAANNPVRCLCSCEQLITIEVHSVMLKMVWQVYPVHILKRCFFPKRP